MQTILFSPLKPEGEMIIRMLLSDDVVAKRLTKKRGAQVFFQSRKEFGDLGKKYGARPIFQKIKDKPHGRMKFEHIHSIGRIRIGGSV